MHKPRLSLVGAGPGDPELITLKAIKTIASADVILYDALVNEQLLNSANLIADFWYTAWVDAGKPDLSGLLTKPFGKPDKKAMKKEFKAYRKGELIEKKLLIARQAGNNSDQQ